MNQEYLVLDTSAILSRKFNLNQENIVIPESVMEEVRLGKIARSLEWHEEGLRIFRPSGSSLKTVRDTAARTGDLEKLSSTDMDVIAVALETGGTIITDDFAIENVASRLGLKFLGADLKPISREIKWQFRCTGCGKRFSSHREECPVCGHEVKRIVKSFKERDTGKL